MGRMKHAIGNIIKKDPILRWMIHYVKIRRSHKKREIRKGKKYYIIGYDDPQSCGWTVWERVVLYSSMYAADHGMIPVVDMQNYKNIYLEDDEIGRVNSWEKFYYQPGGGIAGRSNQIRRLYYS